MGRVRRFLLLGSCHRFMRGVCHQTMYSAATKTARAANAVQCKYGLDCRRANIRHWSEYDHPHTHKTLVAENCDPSGAVPDQNDSGPASDVAGSLDAASSIVVPCQPSAGSNVARDNLGPLVDGESTTMQGTGSSVLVVFDLVVAGF